MNLLEDAIRLGITSSPTLFQFIEQNTQKILTSDSQTSETLLNFLKISTTPQQNGETSSFGKTFERLLISSGFSAIQAPFLGILKQVQLSRHLGFCSLTTLNRVTRCVTEFGYPTRVPLGIKIQIQNEEEGSTQKLALVRNLGQVDTVTVHSTFIRLMLDSAIQIVPSGPIFGTGIIPGSKSISNRVLLMAGLGTGQCTLEGVLMSDDIQVMLDSLRELGVRCEFHDESTGNITVTGSGGQLRQPTRELFLGNSGTSARFLTTAVTLVNRDEDRETLTVLTGNTRMKERPIADLVSALRSNACTVSYLETEGCLPIAVANRVMSGGQVFIQGAVSSQYVSSILISAPYASSPLTLQLAEQAPVSLQYILMTLKLMNDFGIPTRFVPPNRFEVDTGVYTNPILYSVEPDASSATYVLAMAGITGGAVTVRHLGSNSTQGDAQFHTILGSMGCTVSQTETHTSVAGPNGGRRLNGVRVNMETTTDAFMTVAVLAAVAEGRSEVTGIANQRLKECNRILVMVTELTKLGVECGELPDGLWIQGVDNLGKLTTPVQIHCHDDHRIALSFAVLGTVVPNIIITDKDCTAKTYPGFWDDCRSLQVKCVPGSVPPAHGQNADSVFLIGMRGCGKTTFGHLSAVALGYSFLCMDAVLEKGFGHSLTSFVKERGWAAFRSAEAALLKQICSTKSTNTIISCGGGIVETPECVEMLQNLRYVVYIERPWPEVKAGLSLDDNNRAVLPDDLDVVWARRKPLFTKCSTHEFKTSLDDKSTEKFVQFLQNLLRE